MYNRDDVAEILRVVLLVAVAIALLPFACGTVKAADKEFSEDSNREALKTFVQVHQICEQAVAEMPANHFPTPYHISIQYTRCVSATYAAVSEGIEAKAALDFKEM